MIPACRVGEDEIATRPFQSNPLFDRRSKPVHNPISGSAWLDNVIRIASLCFYVLLVVSKKFVF